MAARAHQISRVFSTVQPSRLTKVGFFSTSGVRAAGEGKSFTSNLDEASRAQSQKKEENYRPSTPHDRLVADMAIMKDKPLNKAYFTGKVKYFELLTGLDQCVVKYTNQTPYYSVKPKAEDMMPAEQRHIKWLSYKSMSSYLAMILTEAEYNSIVMRLDQLAGPNKDFLKRLPIELKESLAKFSVSGSLDEQEAPPKQLDSMGRAFAVGHRKEAAVRVWLVKGEGKVVVNGRAIHDYFDRYLDKDTALYPFTLTQTLGKYNAWVIAMGGGTTGQCQAMSLAISKALVIHDPSLESELSEAGCLTRDTRVVERKKTGQPKARKHFTWVKR